ncbi:MAG: hypothetical protein J6K58_14240 [Lachnospiraceae bacterium]|nr:hypothetical protein [Lachnospiraceae bacterium]
MNNTKSGFRKIIFPFILTVLSIIFFLMILIFIFSFKTYYYDKSVSSNLLRYYLVNEDYGSLYYYTTVNRAVGASEDEELTELYAVADYYHNCLYYYGLKPMEGHDISYYEEKMQKCTSKAGTLSYALEDIDTLFQDY